MGKKHYDDIGEIMGNLEADVKVLEGMIDNVSNDLANQKLKDVVREIKDTITDMSYTILRAEAS